MNKSNEERGCYGGVKDKFTDIDFINVFETGCKNGSNNKNCLFLDTDRQLSHDRKPSYSSSEKSLTIKTIKNLPASINPVKLRESSLNRRRYKDEPNSSSGNWSASSESGRTSIGSEFTVQPKSSASSNSLNHTQHLSSGPPSSIISRRRFFNTSASSSITSEGTVTPDLQIHETYDDGETSSVYSCDTEGYYTSFHVDSGLKTLKEEEPVTPLHKSSALSSNNSFGSQSNQTIVSIENEYELFGKGSTSTTTSSAGTICTTLMSSLSDRNLVSGPAVPERKSSLSKFESNLERSYSTSTMGSSLERTGTIKRNGILLEKNVNVKRIESPDSGHNTSSSPVNSNSNWSESSDLEGFDRLERIRVKTKINSSRIPSMCVITPSNSDDEKPIVKAKLLDRLKTVLPTLKKSPIKDEPVYSTAGEYVTISDKIAAVLSGNLNEETEYVSLNELPCNSENNEKLMKMNLGGENLTQKGARVTLDAKGKVVYSSDSLKRRKGAHTTFQPGPFVKQNKLIEISNRKLRPVTSQKSIMDKSIGKGAYVNLQNTNLKGKNELIKKKSPTNENLRRIITRSNSYRMANIDEISIKEKSKKIKNFENELKDEFIRERINYPSCVSPKLSLINKKIDEIEKIDELNFSDSESDTDFKTINFSLNLSLKPNKITIPDDSEKNRARVLSFSSSNFTDIW